MIKDLKKYRNDYNKEKYKSVSIRFHKEKDKDIITWLESKESIKDYIIELINKDIDEVLDHGN